VTEFVFAFMDCEFGGLDPELHDITEIAAIIKKRGLTQQEAAKTLGLTQPRISRLLKGQFRGVSERRLLDCLTRLGRDIRIVVSSAQRNRESGRLTLHIA